MRSRWVISPSQKALLDSLFEVFPSAPRGVLDLGSGRTSLDFLTRRFPGVKVVGMVYPGDERKIGPIKQCVRSKNYRLWETDLLKAEASGGFEIALAHLFLGEASRFGATVDAFLNKIFSMRVDFLCVVNLSSDPLDELHLLARLSAWGDIMKTDSVRTASGPECKGYSVRKKPSSV